MSRRTPWIYEPITRWRQAWPDRVTTMKSTDQVSEKPLPVEKLGHKCFHTRLHLNSCVQYGEGTVQQSAKEIILVTETYHMKSLKNHSFVTLAKWRWRDDLTALHRHTEWGGVNTEEGRKRFQLKNTVGTRTNGYKMAMNKFQLEIKGWGLSTGKWSSETSSWQQRDEQPNDFEKGAWIAYNGTGRLSHQWGKGLKKANQELVLL